MSREVSDAVAAIVGDRVHVGGEVVAEALAKEIVERDVFEMEPEGAIEAGIQAALVEIDDATWSDAFDAVQDRVRAEVEGQAKQIALRMLRELAALGRQEAATTA